MKGDLGNMMKQAQQMQAKMQKAQEEVANLEVEGAAGGGLVKVTMNGKHELRRVQIDDSLIGGDDKDMLEDLVAAAVNDATHRVDVESQEKMSAVTAGIPVPPGFKLPF